MDGQTGGSLGRDSLKDVMKFYCVGHIDKLYKDKLKKNKWYEKWFQSGNPAESYRHNISSQFPFHCGSSI